MLEEILRNLIHNAFKLTNKGQIDIGYIRLPDSPKIELYVRDTSCGMDRVRLVARFLTVL
ncbi:MAG: ATP-binding protein [Massilibacteroides sp.]|nr:ATP-binding protein [Massilibacteroides sp.]